MKDKSIKEIRELEESHLSVYPTLASHTLAADERMIKTNSPFVDFLHKLGHVKKHSKVLDIGCGTGWLVEMFRRKGYEAYGGDILPIEIMHKRYPQANFLFFDIFSPPRRESRKYDLIVIRALGPIEKIADWRELAVFPWIGNNLNDEGVFYFAHDSNGSGIADENRCHQTESAIADILEKTIGPVLYCNRLPNNITFVVQKGVTKKLNDQTMNSTSYILNLWKGPKKNAFYWLVHGMPVLFMPSDDLSILNAAKKQWKVFDYILILRSYPIRTIRKIIKNNAAKLLSV